MSGHDSPHTTPATPSGGGTKAKIGTGFVVLAILMVAWYLYLTSEATPTASTGQQQYTPPVEQVVVEGPKRKLYRFDEYSKGCVPVELRSNASFYPKGGAITIHPPKGASWEDKPGVQSSQDGTNQPPGWYTVCRKDDAAWGVEIWN